MRHTDEEIREASERFEKLADDLDPDDPNVTVDHTDDLRAIAKAADSVARDEAQLTERIALARAHGRSWNRIAVALGVSRQAARQRYADKVGA